MGFNSGFKGFIYPCGDRPLSRLSGKWMRNTNKMQLCNRIYYSKVYWRLNMFSSGTPLIIRSSTLFAASGLYTHVVTGRCQGILLVFLLSCVGKSWNEMSIGRLVAGGRTILGFVCDGMDRHWC